MNLTRKVVLALLGVVLFVALLSANVLVAADRTVLDRGFAGEIVADEDLAGAVADGFADQVDSEAGEEGELPLERSRSELLADAITEEYVRSQIDANLDNTYDYLHGDADELRLVIETEPLKENVVAEVETEVENADLADFGVPGVDGVESMTESEAAFDRQRLAFREAQKERIQAETDRELSDDELEQALAERSGEIRSELVEEADDQLAASLPDDRIGTAVEEPARDLLTAQIDALMGDLSYDEYVTAVEQAKADLREAAVDGVEAELDEQLPAEVELTEDVDDGTMDAFETVRTGVSLTNALVVALPVVALVVAGLLAWLAPTSVAAIEVGVVSALAGAAGVVTSRVAIGRMEPLAAVEEGPTELLDVATAVLTGFFDALALQSTGLVVLGLALVGLGVGIRRGVLLGDSAAEGVESADGVTGPTARDAEAGESTTAEAGNSVAPRRGDSTASKPGDSDDDAKSEVMDAGESKYRPP